MSTDLRITGMMSGIDTESMIESLMNAERVKVDRVKQDRQLVIWRQELYNDINKTFANFILNTRKLFGLTNINSLTGGIRPESYQSLGWVKKVTSSNSAVATVSSTGNAFDGNYTVHVEQLAEGVSAVSSGKIGGKDDDGKAVSLAKIIENYKNPLEGETVEIPSEIKFKVNDIGIVIGNFDEDTKAIQYEDGKYINLDGYLVDENGDLILEDNKKQFVAKVINKSLSEATLTDVAKAINSIGDIGVRASYDAKYDRFFLQTNKTGVDARIHIEDVEHGVDFINALKLNVSHSTYQDDDNPIAERSTNVFEIGKEYKGQKAIINFNGADNIISESNTITVNGITMNIMNTGDFTVNVATDVDGVYEKISEFLEEYNNLVDKVNGLLTQKRYYDYKPLTDAQKKEMDEEEIKLWEERAKSGLLRNDDILQRTMQNIRTAIYKEFDGVFGLITEIGITTEGYTGGGIGGKLIIKDEERLRQAINNNAEGVMELLFKGGEGTEAGIVSRIYHNLMSGMEDIIKKSGAGGNESLFTQVRLNMLSEFRTEYGSISLLDKNIRDYNKRIDDLNYALMNKENYYYSKFAALETALSRMNAQSMWLMQQFGNY